MGLVLCHCLYRRKREASKRRDLTTAFAYQCAYDIIASYEADLPGEQRKHARNELVLFSQSAKLDREIEAWSSIIELFDRAFDQ